MYGNYLCCNYLDGALLWGNSEEFLRGINVAPSLGSTTYNNLYWYSTEYELVGSVRYGVGFAASQYGTEYERVWAVRYGVRLAGG